MPAVRLEPLDDLCQRLGTEPVPASLAIRANLDEIGLSQHLQVLGDSRLAEADVRHELVDRPLAVAQEVEDLPARRFGEG
jgi:hypothetical protein